MLDKIIYFLKYNNATIIILALALIVSGAAWAAGPEAIGEKQTRIEGLDNSLLIAVDLANFNMDFKIEKIQADENYYYVTYSFLDLAVVSNSWQYLMTEKTRKISKKIKEDLGIYLAKTMAKHYEARVRELKEEQALARQIGEQKRLEVTEYSGLVGRTLDLASKVFPGYEAVKKVELPTPDFNPPTPLLKGGEEGLNTPVSADNLTQIYNDYVQTHPEVFNLSDNQIGTSTDELATSTPDQINPSDSQNASSTNESAPLDSSQLETPADASTSSVEIIDLPK